MWWSQPCTNAADEEVQLRDMPDCVYQSALDDPVPAPPGYSGAMVFGRVHVGRVKVGRLLLWSRLYVI